MIYCLYPVLMCLLPIHSLYAQNLGEIHYKEYLKTITLFGFAIITCSMILVWNLKSKDMAEFVFCINFYVLLYAHYIFIALYSEYQRTRKKNRVIFYTIFTLGLLFSNFLIIKYLPLQIIIFTNKILFGLSCILTFFILLDILNKLCAYLTHENSLQKTDQQYEKPKNNDLPNIYHIIVDSHGGFYEKEYSDNDFKDGLLNLGFQICYNAKSNYNYTHLSVPSLLNMDYIQNLIPSNTNKKYLPASTYATYTNNMVFKKLTKKNYKLSITMNKNLIKLFENKKDIYNLNHFRNKKNSLLALLSFSSIFHYIHKNPCPDNFQADVLNLFQEFLLKSKNETNQPLFNYLHVLAPHPPYFVNENGEPNPKKEYNNHSLYKSYQKYINKYLIEFIKELKNNIKENSIIILQGDHGRENPDNINNRYHALFAIYTGDSACSCSIPNNFSFVNLYRYIFNNYFGENNPILENKYYGTIFNDWKIADENNIKD